MKMALYMIRVFGNSNWYMGTLFFLVSADS